MQNLADLHWVPVRGRIKYKVALLTFKTLITHRPMYLHDLLQFHTSPRHLRSSEHHSLHVAEPGPCSAAELSATPPQLSGTHYRST